MSGVNVRSGSTDAKRWKHVRVAEGTRDKLKRLREGVMYSATIADYSGSGCTIHPV